MDTLKEVKAIVRTDSVPSLIRVLESRGVTRFFISHIHVLGAGVDPERFRLSLDEGKAYSEKAKIEFVCKAEAVDVILDDIRVAAGTRHRGDGIIAVSNLDRIMNVHTGDEGYLALL